MGHANKVGTSLLRDNTEMRQSDSDRGGRGIKSKAERDFDKG